ncbi:hypothetical protein BC936DRAFT_145229 [Jimgerdemannia flammicorona]|uniref:Uncharacterized protein n=2 Tax=Jimgerdemannia flammicorona TaxID=994334 RepID=A0A433DND2_9FUNG|nr:hypothetical protein BC936DRAFT_145229 [Jimgerdemannia flammicorona]RUS32023.1 hypothetical protein BC938DRAFT_476470 [Jimgerdemannia flammicorona]
MCTYAHPSYCPQLSARTSEPERTSNANDGFTAGQIGYVNEGVVERSEDVGNTENELARADLGAESNDLLLLDDFLSALGLWECREDFYTNVRNGV